MVEIHIVKKRILVNAVIVILLLLSLLVFPVLAVDFWSKPRPTSHTTYDEVIGNAYTDSKASVGMGVHIGNYYENDPIYGDFLTLRVSVSANARVDIKYDINPSPYVWFDVSNPTNITQNNNGIWLPLPFVDVFRFYLRV